MRAWPFALSLAACTGSTHSAAEPLDAATAVPDHPVAATWLLPAAWRSELIPFPLGFAPSLPHVGIEEARFPPGVFDLHSTAYWSYAFAWRLDDPAALDGATLAAELTAYYRGLMVAVDPNEISMPDLITAAVTDGLLTIHLLDGFNHARPVDLAGTARRVSCGTGSLWVFEIYPTDLPQHGELDQVATDARCGQTPVAPPP